MTTINNHLTLIERVGGIEKAKAIVEGAPESNFPVKWGLSFKTYFRQVGYFVEQWFESKWQTRYSDSDWVDLETLSTAIEHHYYGRSEAEELAAYAELSHEKIEGGAMLVGDFSEARKKVDQLLGNSEEFKAYVVTKFPNRSPKILFQQERINHSDYRFMVPEVQLMSDVWQLKQAEVELLQQYNDDLAGGQCCLYRELKKKDKRIEDLEFYVRQFLDVLASTHASHKEVLPKLLSHLNHLVNPKDESGEILRGEYD